MINPHETNFFLRHRQNIFGNSKLNIIPFVIIWAIFGIPYIFEAIRALSIDFNGHTFLSRVIIFSQGLLMILFYIIISCKIPKFDDIWHIRDELMIAIKITAFGTLLYFLIAILFSASLVERSLNWILITSIAACIAMCGCYSLLFYPLRKFRLPTNISSAYKLFQKHKKNAGSVDDKSHEASVSSENGNSKKQSLFAASGLDDLDRNEKKKIFNQLKAILRHKDGFGLFCNHLMHEFSIENVLFFLETHQWLKYIIFKAKCDQTNDVKIADIDDSLMGIKFAETAPYSQIIRFKKKKVRKEKAKEKETKDSAKEAEEGDSKEEESEKTKHNENTPNTTNETAIFDYDFDFTLSGNNTDAFGVTTSNHIVTNEFKVEMSITDPWMQCVLLFKKYIVNGSYFCINISGESRDKLYQIFGFEDGFDADTKFDNESICDALKEKCSNLNELFHVFDEQRKEISYLMQISMSRFMQTDEYKNTFQEDEEDEEI